MHQDEAVRPALACKVGQRPEELALQILVSNERRLTTTVLSRLPWTVEQPEARPLAPGLLHRLGAVVEKHIPHVMRRRPTVANGMRSKELQELSERENPLALGERALDLFRDSVDVCQCYRSALATADNGLG